MGRILVFHLSDLHIGSHHLGSESWAAGFFGHHFALLTQLKIAIANAKVDLNTTSDDVLVHVVGGDLTRVGGDYDFHIALTYLLSELTWIEDGSGNQRRLGLDLPMKRFYTIPGNHDHWKGYRTRLAQLRPPAYNQDIFNDFFELTPWRHPVKSMSGDFVLELFGVDSNEGLKTQLTNLLAGGAMSSEELNGKDAAGNVVKDGLEQLLARAKVAEADGKPRVRAILCHHSLGTNNGPLNAQPLDNPSRVELLKLARLFGVRGVLTGHTHYFADVQWTGAQPPVWEIRCGTTLQLSSQMPQPLPQRSQLLAPGFLVHEFELDAKAKGVQWKVWKYQWDGTKFRQNPQSFNVP